MDICLPGSSLGNTADLLCFSHLRWDFVFQRPQHLMTRAASTMRVFFVQDPSWVDEREAHFETRVAEAGVVVVSTFLPHGLDGPGYEAAMRGLVDRLILEEGIRRPVLWYYSPHALAFTDHLVGAPAVFDCMDELSAFKDADPGLPVVERALLARVDLVFTGGISLFEAKRRQHGDVHAFPSGVDAGHFLPARGALVEPRDQAGIPHPRMGFFGVLDERLDGALLGRVADLRPGTQFILVGPVAKIDPEDLPQRGNIHYLGAKSYAELPAYVGGWDVALMPFARNAATRFISPTKTPEYLAAGRPVVSTGIVDVVAQYGGMAGVHIADTAEAFAEATDAALVQATLMQTTLMQTSFMQTSGGGAWLSEADAVLAGMSWDAIWGRMAALIVARRTAAADVSAGPDVLAAPNMLAAPNRLAAPGVMRRARYDVVVVGAGFAGAVLAERLAAVSGQLVLVVDRRGHIGGNAYDCLDGAGVLIHPYGPHIFHTNSEAVLAYLSRFTAWRPYEHRVVAAVRGMELPVPINRTTINRFFGVDLAEADVAAFLAARAESREVVRTSADVVLGTVGRELYEAFFQGYTRKQWGLDPSELDKSVTARVPTRTGDDDRYFTDRHQVMPLHGYTRMFERMLDRPGITVATDTEWTAVQGRGDHVVFTGPVDEFFGHRHGKLPYRSLQFRHETHDVAWKQRVAVVNYPDPAVPFTRVTEFKHLTGQEHAKTSLCCEYPAAEGDPYYPVPRPENAALYQRYLALADAAEGVTFAGRLATYRYYNMDQVVGQALATYQRLAGRSQIAAE